MRKYSGYNCVRLLFCFVNCLMWVVGCGLLGLGIWLRISYGGYAALTPYNSFLSTDSLCIAAGVIVFVVSFFGCCGSWFQYRYLLILYFVIVTVISILEFAAITLAFVYRNEIAGAMKDELKRGLRLNYKDDPENSLYNTWNHIQSNFSCCGVDGTEDWHYIVAWPDKEYVPDSCCQSSELVANCGKQESDKILHSQGCYDQVQIWLIERLHILGIIGLILAFIQLFGLISSVLLFCTLRIKRYSDYYTYKSYNHTN